MQRRGKHAGLLAALGQGIGIDVTSIQKKSNGTLSLRFFTLLLQFNEFTYKCMYFPVQPFTLS